MAQNFIQPKGSLNTQVDISNLQNQLAQMFASQQPQGHVTQNAIDPTRQTVNQLIQEKLLPVEMPKFTTIQDIFKAPKGEKLNTFGQYLNTPSGQNLIGGVLGLLSGGTFLGSPNDNYATYLQGDMNRRQAHAIQQMNEQNEILKALNSAYNQRDIADMNDKRARELAEQELKWRTEESEKDRTFRRQENAANRANSLAISQLVHGGRGGSSSRGGSVTGEAANINNINDLKMTAAERKALTENKTTLANIQSGLKALEQNPNAYQWYKGILGADIANRIDPKGVGTRTQIDNITAVYRKWLTGAQMSDKERKAYERFLPAPTDNYNIVKAKLNGMKGAIERSNDAILSNYGVSQNVSSDPLGLGL